VSTSRGLGKLTLILVAALCSLPLTGCAGETNELVRVDAAQATELTRSQVSEYENVLTDIRSAFTNTSGAINWTKETDAEYFRCVSPDGQQLTQGATSTWSSGVNNFDVVKQVLAAFLTDAASYGFVNATQVGDPASGQGWDLSTGAGPQSGHLYIGFGRIVTLAATTGCR
jgi:hypothetical protein